MQRSRPPLHHRGAVRCAKRRAPASTALVFDFIQRLLLKQTAAATPTSAKSGRSFIGKFQQITSPVAAKGIEDTAFYVYNRLVSLNEVGSDPTRFGIAPERRAQWMAERQARWPAALSATSTHDTKRGEDVRARLNVLSEMPGAWKAAVTKWRALNRRFKTDIGGMRRARPKRGIPDLSDARRRVAVRAGDERENNSSNGIVAYMTKAMREAKVHTTWLSPDEDYERAVVGFVRVILERRRQNLFLQLFEPFQARVAEAGIYNSLSQLLIKITAPGIPDFYQGTEFWDLTLVDPDNRRPVDYQKRARCVGGAEALSLAGDCCVARGRPSRWPDQDVRDEPGAACARATARADLRARFVRASARRGRAPRVRVRVRARRRATGRDHMRPAAGDHA